MNKNEAEQIEKVFALLALGGLTALKDGLVSEGELGHLMFWPACRDLLARIEASRELIDLFGAADQIGDVQRACPSAAPDCVAEIETRLKSEIKRLEAANCSERWYERLRLGSSKPVCQERHGHRAVTVPVDFDAFVCLPDEFERIRGSAIARAKTVGPR